MWTVPIEKSGLAIDSKYVFHMPSTDACRKFLAERYPQDKAKFNTMHCRQIRRIFESVRTKEMFGVWKLKGIPA
jgi:hypothetical protein